MKKGKRRRILLFRCNTAAPQRGQKGTLPMRQTTTNEAENPAEGFQGAGTTAERYAFGFPSQGSGQSPLDQLVRDGARKMLQAALENEVWTYPRFVGARRLIKRFSRTLRAFDIRWRSVFGVDCRRPRCNRRGFVSPGHVLVFMVMDEFFFQ